jgi:hypothetical protein
MVDAIDVHVVLPAAIEAEARASRNNCFGTFDIVNRDGNASQTVMDVIANPRFQ